MNRKAIRSDVLYRKMITASKAEKENIYRYELMKPFEYKWQCVGVPLKSEVEGGYDVVTASSMGGGYMPSQISKEQLVEIEKISMDTLWKVCEDSICSTLDGFEQNGIKLPTQNYIFTILLGDSQNPMSAMTGDCYGDGGIPGYIIGTIIPNEKSLEMLPVIFAHEANHTVRWQFMKWSQNITLADMIISEGLAENFSAFMFGEEKVGRWVTETSTQTLEAIIKPSIKKNLSETDFNKLSSFLYGDEIMAMRGGAPVGMPYCAGYACGYHLIRNYLKKTNKSIYEATITNTAEILREMEDFWN